MERAEPGHVWKRIWRASWIAAVLAGLVAAVVPLRIVDLVPAVMVVTGVTTFVAILAVLRERGIPFDRPASIRMTPLVWFAAICGVAIVGVPAGVLLAAGSLLAGLRSDLLLVLAVALGAIGWELIAAMMESVS